ncbi:MAG TPA: hypothetical protein VGE02_14485 [Gemmatimonadales bacterium]
MAPLVAPFRWLGRAVAGEQLRLPDELLATFPELADARWRRGGLFVRVGGWCIGTSTVAGITLWRTVWLAPGVPLHPALLLHELRHVHQFGADLLFPLSYIWESFRRGYRGNRYEADAIAYARHRLLGGRHPPPQKEP